MHDAWVRLQLFQQLYHSEAVHSDPNKLKKRILAELGSGAGIDPIERMIAIAREQQIEREARAD